MTTVQLLKIVLHFYRPQDLSPGMKYGDGRFDVMGDGTNQSLRTVRHKILPILGTSTQGRPSQMDVPLSPPREL